MALFLSRLDIRNPVKVLMTSETRLRVSGTKTAGAKFLSEITFSFSIQQKTLSVMVLVHVCHGLRCAARPSTCTTLMARASTDSLLVQTRSPMETVAPAWKILVDMLVRLSRLHRVHVTENIPHAAISALLSAAAPAFIKRERSLVSLEGLPRRPLEASRSLGRHG